MIKAQLAIAGCTVANRFKTALGIPVTNNGEKDERNTDVMNFFCSVTFL
jgi:hypothetical protein